MAGADGTNTYSAVPAPPAGPAEAGLIASLPPAYLIDDTGRPDGQAADDDQAAGPLGLSRRPIANGLVRWEAGLQYQPEQVCASGTAQDPCAPDFDPVLASPDLVKAMPYLVWAGDSCSAVGWAAHDYRGRAIRSLLAVESYQIARELWTGELARAKGWPNGYLASAAADELTLGPVAPKDGLALLEEALAVCGHGQRGIVHVSPLLGSALSDLGQTERVVSNGTVVTYRNTLIVADAGYDGSGPAGEPAVSGSQWAYATLMVAVRRGPVEVIPDTLGEALERSVNRIDWRAWRPAVATFVPCCLFAVEIDLPLPLVGGAS